MGIVNLDKLPRYAHSALKPFIDEILEIYKEDLISIFVYGSVTGPDYDARFSDINVSVVLKDVSLARLRAALPAVKRALKRKVAVPLFMSPYYIKSSLDVFPVEFGSMKNTRLVLFGEDVLSGIEIKKEDLRRECETQLKGRLITMRQAYLERALDKKGVERVVKASLSSLLPVFSGILMMNTGATVPSSREAMVRLLANGLKVDLSSVIQVMRESRSDGKLERNNAEEFLEEFISQVEKLAEAVDKM